MWSRFLWAYAVYSYVIIHNKFTKNHDPTIITVHLGNFSSLHDIVSSVLPLKVSQVLGTSCIYSLRESGGFYQASGYAHAPSACFPQTLQMKMHPWYRQLELEKLQSANSNMAFNPILTKSTSTWVKISLFSLDLGHPPTYLGQSAC